MNKHLAQTAFLLFTRTREAEARAKDLSGRHHLRTNSLIAEHLIGHAERTARASGLSCFVIDSDHQHGSSFGEKLANAFEEIYAMGYKGVIAIGNDCPSLTPDDLNEAAESLYYNAAVIGPAADGGVYLIGLREDLYDRTQFLSLPWATAQLTQSIYQTYLDQGAGIYTCSRKADIDSATQLSTWIRLHKQYLSLVVQLRALLASLATKTASAFLDPIAAHMRIYIGSRAPPAC